MSEAREMVGRFLSFAAVILICAWVVLALTVFGASLFGNVRLAQQLAAVELLVLSSAVLTYVAERIIFVVSSAIRSIGNGGG